MEFATMLENVERKFNVQMDPKTRGSLTEALEAHESSIRSLIEVGDSNEPVVGPPETVAQVGDHIYSRRLRT